MIVRFEIRRAVLLRIHVFWGMMPCCYVKSSDVSEYHIEFTFDSSAISSLICCALLQMYAYLIHSTMSSLLVSYWDNLKKLHVSWLNFSSSRKTSNSLCLHNSMACPEVQSKVRGCSGVVSLIVVIKLRTLM